MKQVTLWKRPLRAAELAYENDSSGFWVDRLEGDHSIELVRATVYADQDGTLYLDESDDEGTTSAALATVSVSAEVTYKLSWTTLTKRWYRFRYVNGSTDQTKFRVTKETAGEDLVLIQLLHDRLNANVNLQVGDADVTTSNSVPVNVRSIQAGNNNIGDVDIASMPDVTIGAEIPTGTKVIGKVGIDQVTANANEVVTKTGSVTAATLSAETTKVIGTVNNKVADGDDVALGAKTDDAQTDPTQTASAIAFVKGWLTQLNSVIATIGSAVKAVALQIAGSDGTNARILKTTSDGTVLTQLTGSNLALVAGTAEIGSTGKAQNKVTLANAVAIIDTNNHDYKLTTDGLLTEEQIRKYSEFKVSIYSTHDQAATVTVGGSLVARGNDILASAGVLYTEANNLAAATNGYLLLQSAALGTGAVSTQCKSVPGLKGVFSNLIIRVKFGVAPTAGGALTIIVEMN